MMKTSVNYFDGHSALSVEAELRLQENGECQLLSDDLQYDFVWAEAKLSPALAKTARSLKLPNGAKCEISDLAVLARMEAQQDAKQKSRGLLYWVNLMESRWHFVLITAVLVIVFAFSVVTYGLPTLSKGVALALPLSIDQQLSEGASSLLESKLLKPSEIPLERQQVIATEFTRIINQLDDGHSFSLIFRKGLGANAFAFPSGIILVTDGLVNLAQTDAEVVSVLLHEMGHVVNRHGLRLLLQGSALTLLITVVTGDFSASTGFIAALPVMLLEQGYSRDLEREADDFSLNYMQAQGLSTQAFADILQRISGDDQNSVWQYASSHPTTAERIRRFQQTTP